MDEMHTMHLGVFGVYVAYALWEVVKANVWKIGAGRPQEVVHELVAQRMSYELNLWYKRQKRDHPDKPVYELAQFSLQTLGAKDRPSLTGPKAAETGSLLGFAVSMCQTYEQQIDRGAALTRAGEALLEYHTITRRAEHQLDAVDTQGIMDATLRFLAVREQCGLPYIPKMHLMVHLAYQVRFFGNPRLTATWEDEGVNRQFAAVCKSAHASVWHRRVLATMNHVLLAPAQVKAGQKRGRV